MDNNQQRPKGQGSYFDEFRAGISALLLFLAVVWVNNPNADTLSHVFGVLSCISFALAIFPKFWITRLLKWLWRRLVK